MDQKARQLLDVFINHAHKSMSRSLDTRRFIDFVIAVHKESLAASPDEVLDLATQADFPEHMAVRLSMMFSYGMELLKRYDEARGLT